MIRVRQLFLIAGILSAMSSCQGDSASQGNSLGEGPKNLLPSLQVNPAPLRKAESCDEIRESLRRYLQSIVDEANAQYAKCVSEAQQGDSLFSKSWSCLEGSYGYAAGGIPEGGISVLDTSVVSSDVGSGSGKSGGEQPLTAGVDYSTTNVQEAGVDEADFVKTDGNFIYLLSNGHLVILASRPAESTRLLSRTAIEGSARDMYLKGNRVVVFSTGHRIVARRKEESTPKSMAYFNPYGASYLYRPLTKLTMLDVSDRTQPKVVRETYLEGGYSTSRMIGSRAVLVLSLANFNPSEMIGYDPSRDDPYFIGAYALELERYIPKVRVKILIGTAPSAAVPGAPGTASPPGAETVVKDYTETDCSRFFLPSTDDAGQGFISVYSYPMEDSQGDLGHTSIIGYPGIAYASTNSLYITQSYFPPYFWYTNGAAREPGEESTSIHKFDLASDPVNPAYVASGSVPGHLLNQFSMGEFRNLLRAATTEGRTWGTGEWAPKNNVFVLQQQGGALAIVGEARGFAANESLYAARFIGDAGYVVTFRQTDPLFVIDLKDPTAPKLAGKLELPGYSTYLHPMDDTHLLSIGYDGDADGRILGLALSMFDVGDLNNPLRIHKLSIPTGYSKATYDHLAFNYFAPKNLLALPLEWSEWSYEKGKGSYRTSGFSGHQVYNVTTASGFQLLGQVDHWEFCTEPTPKQYSYCYVNPTRSIVIQDDVVTLSNRGVKVNPISDFGRTTASVPLPPENR
ncbi:MAG: beta-propeller domain-containing protein [Nitrospirae bacterium]|nr:beta-propeller domain-containing protein [Nitrospirota bacterium]